MLVVVGSVVSRPWWNSSEARSERSTTYVTIVFVLSSSASHRFFRQQQENSETEPTFTNNLLSSKSYSHTHTFDFSLAETVARSSYDWITCVPRFDAP